jgi:hypothetical protein
MLYYYTTMVIILITLLEFDHPCSSITNWYNTTNYNHILTLLIIKLIYQLMYYYYILYHINYPFGNFPTEPVTDQGQPVNLKSGQSQKGRLNRPVLIVKLITKKTASTVYIYISCNIYSIYDILLDIYIHIYIQRCWPAKTNMFVVQC